MATVVELEEIVEEVVRANTRKASLEKENVSFLLLGARAEKSKGSLGASMAVHNDETRALHERKLKAKRLRND